MVAVWVAGLAGPALALHRETNGAVQITSGVEHQHPAGRSWGNQLAFTSSQDLAGEGNTTRQVFLFNLAGHDCLAGTAQPEHCTGVPEVMRQVTHGAGTPNNPTVSRVPSPNQTFQNQYVIFDAAGSYTGGGTITPLVGAAAFRRQIFKFDLLTSALERMTSAADGDSERPSVNGGGGVFVFESTARTIGDRPNATGTRQVYVYDWNNGGGLKRVSFARNVCGSGSEPCPVVGHSRNASISESGEKIAFESSAELLGDGRDTGVSQIFHAFYDKTDAQDVTLRQITRGNGASRNPLIGEAGRLIAFETTATDLPGSPTSLPGSRIVVADVQDPQAPVFIHVSRPDVHGDCHWPALNPSADDAPLEAGNGPDMRVAMICTGDPLQNGTTGNRVFTWAHRTQTLYQLTGSGDVQGPLAQNVGKWFVTFASDGNLTDTSACGHQIYALNYYTDPFSGVTPWQPATGIGEVPPDAISNGSSTIGRQRFEVVPGLLPGGSTVTVTWRDDVTSTDVTETSPVETPAAMTLDFGAPGAGNQAPITGARDLMTLPPVPLGGGWTACFEATGDGAGTLDCDGGGSGGDVLVSVDHVTNDVDPACQFGGCLENDVTCQGTLTGPHTVAGDAPVCNGLPGTVLSGPYESGGARLAIPATFSTSRDPGLDGVPCTLDDLWLGVQDIPVPFLRLVTGRATGRIVDRDAVPGQALETSEPGTPFSCTDLRLGNLGGARLVGVVPILDLPFLPVGGLHDVLVGFDLVAARGVPLECGASCNTNLDCDDGNACNGAEFCGTNQLCTPGTPPACDDGDACNGAESCDPDVGCVPGVPCIDENDCDGLETCTPETGCVPGTPIVCDDAGQGICDGSEHCDPFSGLCVGGTPPPLDDGNPCTLDACDPVAGVTHQPLTDPTIQCSDGNACTVSDGCVAGACVGTAKVCGDDGNVCNGVPACNPANGDCEVQPPPVCNDGNPCTDDSCQPATGCRYDANDTNSCTDDSLCTGEVGTPDRCSGGACVPGTPTVCADNGNLCDGVPACNPVTGACVNGPPVECSDGDTCTSDACNPTTGTCEYTTLPNGAACNDFNACTGPAGDPDVCVNGNCAPGALITCDDGNACTLDGTCDPVTSCPAKAIRDCDDGNPCTDDACDPAVGCRHTNNAASCDDANACTAGDHCVAGGCEPGAPVVCEGTDPCAGVPICDPAAGCVAGTPLDCDDGNGCTSDACQAGRCVHTALDDAPCTDGDACTTEDACTGGVCAGRTVSCVDDDVCDGAETCDPLTGACHAGTPLDCDDGDACTIDLACDPVAGCQHQRKPNYVVCRIEALITLVRSVDAGDLGGRRRQLALLKRLGSARKRAEMGLIGTGARSRKNLSRAQKRVQAFTALVQTGMLRGRIPGNRGQQLVTLAGDTRGELAALVRARS